MESDKRKLISSFFFSAIIIIILWVIKLVEWMFELDFSTLGIYPLRAEGLKGIIFAPLIHGDFSHLSANSGSLMFLSWMLFYFYRPIAFRVFFLVWILGGLWTWLLARESWHIGASGVVYGLATFLFISGLIRRNPRLMATTLVVIFLYGSMVWGVIPDFFPHKNISWESHLMGAIAGIVLAIFYRKEGPKRKIYSWEWDELEEDDDDDDDPDAYWKKENQNYTW